MLKIIVLHNVFGNHDTVLPSMRFSAELGYFNTVAAGCFSFPWVEATPIIWYLAPANANFTRGTSTKTVYFAPRNTIFTRGPPRKRHWLVLSSNWEDVVVKTWQPWRETFFSLIESSIEHYLFEIDFCNIINVFTVTFDKFNAALLNRIIKKNSYWLLWTL